MLRSAANVALEQWVKPLSKVLAALGALSAVAWAPSAAAAVMFSVSQAVAGDIALGSSVQIHVNIQSDAGTTSDVLGVSFMINANDPSLSGGVTVGGRFTAGTNGPFLANGAFHIPFPESYQVFGGNSGGPGLTLTTTPTLLATLTLDTIGASLGTYTIGLSSLFAADTQGDDMRVGALTNPALTYKIVAASVTPTPGVPEPASAALALLALATLGQQRRQARRA